MRYRRRKQYALTGRRASRRAPRRKQYRDRAAPQARTGRSTVAGRLEPGYAPPIQQ